MILRPFHSWRHKVLAALFALLVLPASVAILPRIAWGQQPTGGSRPAGASGDTDATGSVAKAQASSGQKGGQKGGENLAATEQEDEEAVYKKSAVVRTIGRAFHLSPEGASVLFEDFNFLILAGAILLYGGKALPKFFRGRQQKIDQQLQEARVATGEANQRLQEVEARLGRLDHEIEELRARAEKDGAADEQRIKASIEEERKRIVAASEHEIGALSAVAERNLRKFAAELAVARASARLQLTEQDDRALIRDFARNVSADVNRDLQERRN